MSAAAPVYPKQITDLFINTSLESIKNLSSAERKISKKAFELLSNQDSSTTKMQGVDSKDVQQIKTNLQTSADTTQDDLNVLLKIAIKIFKLFRSVFKAIGNLSGLRVSSTELLTLAATLQKTFTKIEESPKKTQEENKSTTTNTPLPSQEEPKTAKESKPTNNIESEIAEDDGDIIISQEEFNRLTDALDEYDGSDSSEDKSTRKKTFSEKWEDNYNFALDQQEAEEPQDFVLSNKQINYAINTELKQLTYIQNAGIASSQGRRPNMEDTHIVDDFEFVFNGKKRTGAILGVFDGHDGSDASVFVKDNIKDFLLKEIEKMPGKYLDAENIHIAIVNCFKALDQAFKSDDAGTTAVLAFIINKWIFIANVGDSRACYIKDGEIFQLTEDAKPSIQRYKKDVEKRGGLVFNHGGAMRVNGMLGLARAIGDHSFNKDGIKFVLPNPKITVFDYNPNIENYLLLACDGLFERGTTNEIGDAINEIIDQPSEKIAEKLVQSAIVNGSRDNITVIFARVYT